MVGSSDSYSPQDAQNAMEHQTFVSYVQKDLTRSKATAALVRSMLGPVIFTFPSLYQKTGFLPGLLLTLVSATWSTCTMMMLAKAGDWTCRASALKKTTCYREATCERISRALNYAVAAFQIGTCCFQVKFMTTHTAFIVKMVNCSFCSESSYAHLSVLPCACMVGTITNLTLLAFLALLANALVAVVVVVILQEAVSNADLRISSLCGHANFGILCQTFGAIIFAFEGQSLILTLRNRMQQPGKLSSPVGVVPLSMLLITTVFVITGSVGFIALGERSPDSVLLSDQVITHKWVQAAVIGIMLFAVMASYPFTLLAVIDILEEPWKASLERCSKNVKKLPLTFSLKLLLSLLVGALALGVSKLDSIASLLGGSVGMLICFVVPPLVLLPLELERQASSVLKKRLLIVLRVGQSFGGVAVACFTLTANFAKLDGQ